MSESDIEILRAAYTAYNDAFDDRDPITALRAAFQRYLDPEIEWINESASPDEPTAHGLEEVIRWFVSGLEVWQSMRQIPEEFRQFGDRVLVLVRAEATERERGVELSESWAHVCTLRGGKIMRLEQFRDRDRALEAASSDE
jgi:uncharacterized protein